MTSLDLTYDLIPASFAMVVERLDAVQNRIQSLMVFSGSFLLTGPALAAVASREVSFESPWFHAAIALAVFNVALGLVMISYGSLRLARPHDVHSEWLQLDVEEFKWWSIWWANVNLDHNLRLANVKGLWSVAMAGILIAELALLIVWGISQVR